MISVQKDNKKNKNNTTFIDFKKNDKNKIVN